VTTARAILLSAILLTSAIGAQALVTYETAPPRTVEITKELLDSAQACVTSVDQSTASQLVTAWAIAACHRRYFGGE